MSCRGGVHDCAVAVITTLPLLSPASHPLRASIQNGNNFHYKNADPNEILALNWSPEFKHNENKLIMQYITSRLT